MWIKVYKIGVKGVALISVISLVGTLLDFRIPSLTIILCRVPVLVLRIAGKEDNSWRGKKIDQAHYRIGSIDTLKSILSLQKTV